MKYATYQINDKENQIKMTQLASQFWLRLLGDKNQLGRFSGNGRNGANTEMQLLAEQPEMLDFTPKYWLRLLGNQTDRSSNSNGEAKVGLKTQQKEHFSTEFWLRLLGNLSQTS